MQVEINKAANRTKSVKTRGVRHTLTMLVIVCFVCWSHNFNTSVIVYVGTLIVVSAVRCSGFTVPVQTPNTLALYWLMYS